eukprot:COSAG06_NODE_72736_length_166_cov_410.626866_1_plen_35_part_10
MWVWETHMVAWRGGPGVRSVVHSAGMIATTSRTSS